MYGVSKIVIKKIFVCCPGNAITGGPELLHQLVHTLRLQGKNAFISYYPFDKNFLCPEPYRHYGTTQLAIEDNKNNLIILPEVATKIAAEIKNCDIAIWWLSVDNYFDSIGESIIHDKLRHLKNIIQRKKLSVQETKNFRHFYQSEYARVFLKKNSITGTALTDFIGEVHTSKKATIGKKIDIVAYNPRKGKKITKKIIKHAPLINFKPIENMTPEQVRELLDSAKLYIDFGPHPGKDRLPREAAIAGCCIITGTRGAAKNPIDIEIPQKYKINEGSSDFHKKVAQAITDVLENFDERTKEFSGYRNKIIKEQQLFQEQVYEIFKEY